MNWRRRRADASYVCLAPGASGCISPLGPFLFRRSYLCNVTDSTNPTNLPPSDFLLFVFVYNSPLLKQTLLLLCISVRHQKMLHQSLSKPSISIPIPIRNPPPSSLFTVRCAESVDSQPKASSNAPRPPPSSATKLMQSEASTKSGPYPGGMMGPYTGRDPNVKKPLWLRQRAPQGQRFEEVKESLSRLNLNTVCEEAQCPNIGEVPLFSSFISCILLRWSSFWQKSCFKWFWLVIFYQRLISMTVYLELAIGTCM